MLYSSMVRRVTSSIILLAPVLQVPLPSVALQIFGCMGFVQEEPALGELVPSRRKSSCPHYAAAATALLARSFHQFMCVSGTHKALV